jgi:gamma-glutamyltranspeptidase / glutathione hydrolase
MQSFCRSIALLSLGFLVSLPATAVADERDAKSSKGMVVCVSPPAAEVGIAILKQGGNGVDAAVAVAFAMAVTYPPAGNIGGGGFMLVYPGKGQEPVVFEYRETAPAAVNRDTFVKETNWQTHRAVGVPGTVRGLALAHQRFGKLPWKAVVEPAVKLAQEGFVLTSMMAGSLNGILASVGNNPEFTRCFGKNGGKEDWVAGDRLVQKDLARTLSKIAEEGPDTFYTGELAELLEAEMKRGGGFITRADLAAYKAVERKPIHGTYRGYDVYGPPPPSSGGIGLVEMFNVVENFDLKKYGRNSPEAAHIMVEAMRRAYCDRAHYLGDPAFTKVPEHLTSKDYAKTLVQAIDLNKATPSETLATEIPLTNESDETTHFSIIDADGMAISNTYTLENSYGSRVVVKGAGYLLNNEMGDFNTRPDVTTRTGRIGTPPNQVAPGKRMLSSQTPTVVAKDGKAFLITGSPGSRTIINTVLCVVTNVIDFDMDIRAAVDAPRLHHQWFPEEVRFEGMRDFPEVVKGLRQRGHAMRQSRQGDAHSIWIDPKTGTYYGAADKRIDGKAAGW